MPHKGAHPNSKEGDKTPTPLDPIPKRPLYSSYTSVEGPEGELAPNITPDPETGVGE